MNINRLLSRFILNKAEKEENEALNQWKDESEENLEALRQIVTLNKTADDLAGYRKTEPQEAWKKLEKKIGNSEKPGNIRYIRYAAAAAALILISFMAYRYLIPGGETTAVEQGVTVASGMQKITLRDGSVVTLDHGSRLTENGTRRLSLEGRAYFDVVPDSDRPFFVKLAHGSVTVLGTEFNITTSESRTEVYVTEGRVKFSYQDDNIILNPGDMAEVNNGLLNIYKPEYKPEVWKTRILRFENQSLASALQQIAAYYDLRLDFNPQEGKDNCRINTSFTDESLEDVLKEIQMLTGLQYEIKNKTIVVRSFKC